VDPLIYNESLEKVVLETGSMMGTEFKVDLEVERREERLKL